MQYCVLLLVLVYCSAGHTCFDGLCDVTCDGTNPICADDDGLLEGSMSAFFPIGRTKDIDNPYYMVCVTCNKTEWKHFETRFHRNSDYCSNDVRRMAPFHSDTAMLHLVDTQIFDFFTGIKVYTANRLFI
jgi:hypothetical protein